MIRGNLVGPNFVWMLPGWYQLNWWNVSNTDCTAEEMKTGLEHSFIYSLNHVVTNNLSRVILSEKVSTYNYIFKIHAVVLTECVTISKWLTEYWEHIRKSEIWYHIWCWICVWCNVDHCSCLKLIHINTGR